MAKRFIDTEFFRDSFVRALEPRYRILYVYIITECSHAGIWKEELDIASARLGFDYHPEKTRQAFASRVLFLGDEGEKWVICGFLAWQYGADFPRPGSNPHKGAVRELQRANILKTKEVILRVSKGLRNPLARVAEGLPNPSVSRSRSGSRSGSGSGQGGSLRGGDGIEAGPLEEDVMRKAVEFGGDQETGQAFFDRFAATRWRYDGEDISRTWPFLLRKWVRTTKNRKREGSVESLDDIAKRLDREIAEGKNSSE